MTLIIFAIVGIACLLPAAFLAGLTVGHLRAPRTALAPIMIIYWLVILGLLGALMT